MSDWLLYFSVFFGGAAFGVWKRRRELRKRRKPPQVVAPTPPRPRGELRALVANCIIQGEEVTHRGAVSARDTIRLTCEGRDVVLIQRPEMLKGSTSQSHTGTSIARVNAERPRGPALKALNLRSDKTT